MLIKEDTIKEQEQQSSAGDGSQMSTDIQHEDYGVVSVEGASLDGERSTSSSKEMSSSGILILSGEEIEDIDMTTNGTKNLSLSFPGNDSFPSEIGSLRDYTEEPPEPERTTQIVPRMEAVDFMTRLKEFYRPRKARVSLVGVLVASVLMTVYFAGQRNSWRSSAFQLEEENLLIKRELEEARKAFLDLQSLSFRLEEENLQVKRELEEGRKAFLDLQSSAFQVEDEYFQLKREFEDARSAFLDLRSFAFEVEEENLQLKRGFEEARKAFLDLRSAALEVEEENFRRKLELEEARKTLLTSQASLLYFAGQRESWESSAFQLEEENLQLKHELEEAREAFLDSLLKFDEDDPTTKLVDNCWLRAGASLQLGSCGEEARDYLWESLESLYNY